MNSIESTGRKLRIAIDCRIDDFRQGIGTAVQALARAYSQSAVDDQEYTFLIREDMRDHLAAFAWGPCSVSTLPSPSPSKLKSVLRRVPALRSLRERFRSYPLGVPVSDEFVESQGFDLVHFPTQVAYKTSLPSIYQPHDLQHLHYPQYFRKDEFAQRESWYRAFCAQATFVCVQTQWTKADVVAKYNLRPETVAVIPWGVALDHDLVATKPTALKRKYKVGDRFFFYPAVTWPHKNHLCLLHALRTLRDEHNLTPSLVCTGAVTSYHKVLARAASETGIADQVRYLGFVPIEDLQGLYDAATAMVYPSRFEGFGLPILEAFHAGTPVLCSNSSVLPEVAQDGALYFDPDDAGELAALMFQVLQRAQTRTDLAEAGRRVVSQYSFENTARQFQALYRRCVSPVAGKLSNTLTCAN